jgi:AraC-like DNA-binding protein
LSPFGTEIAYLLATGTRVARILKQAHNNWAQLFVVQLFALSSAKDVDMDRRVEATIQLMKTSGHQYLSTADMARRVGLSPWYFTHLFKTETSKSPMRYRQELRMQQAEELCAKTLLSLKEVVFALGLKDRSHFSREFKRLHGMTPKEFIAQRRSYREDRT